MINVKFSKKDEIIFLISVSFFWFAQYVYIPYQTIYLTSINVTTSFIGIIVGAYGISQMLLRLPVGLSADIVRKHKYFIMIGGLSSGVASLFRIIIPNGFGFLVANLFSGLASSMWISFMVFYTDHFSKEEQQSATARVVMFNNIGMLMGFVASTLLYNTITMRGICILSVVGGLMTLLLSFNIKEENPQKGEHDSTYSTRGSAYNIDVVYKSSFGQSRRIKYFDRNFINYLYDFISSLFGTFFKQCIQRWSEKINSNSFNNHSNILCISSERKQHTYYNDVANTSWDFERNFILMCNFRSHERS